MWKFPPPILTMVPTELAVRLRARPVLRLLVLTLLVLTRPVLTLAGGRSVRTPS